MRTIKTLLALACLAGSVSATIVNVPGDQPTIQDAINAASPTDTVLIAPGAYAENVVVNKSLTVMGSGEALTTVYPDFSDVGPTSGPSFGNSQIFVVAAHNVTVTQLTLDGDNPSLAGGTLVNGANVDARNGIIEADGPWNGTTVHHTTIKNIYLRGIYARSGGAGFAFHDNTVTNVAGNTSSIAIMAWMASGRIADNAVSLANDAIGSNHSRGITYSGNTITSSGSGVHSDNNNSQGGGFADTLLNNNVSNSTGNGYGVWVFFPNGVNPLVENNTATNVDVGLFAWGGGATTGVTTFRNNQVDGQNRPNSVGAYVSTGLTSWTWVANVSALFTGNTIINCTNGMAVQAESGYSADLHGWRNSLYGNSDGLWTEGTGTVTASMLSCYWGDISGPFNLTTNSLASGNSVADNCDYSPWWGGDYLSSIVVPWVWGVNSSNGSTIQEGIDSSASGDLLKVSAGYYALGPQMVVSEDIRIEGSTLVGNPTVIIPTDHTGSSGDAKGWFLVQPTGSLSLSDLTLDGAGFNINQGIRCYGAGNFSNVHFKNMSFGAGTYLGIGVVAFGTKQVIVDGCRFENIGRVGSLFYGSGITSGVFRNNTYVGKGTGDWLDYSVEVGAGAVAEIRGNTISACRGVASVDGSGSAGVLVSTYFGSGTKASLYGNKISDCSAGMTAGYDAAEASQITVANGNHFIGNDYGIATVTAPALSLMVYGNYFGSTVNAEDNTGSSHWDNWTLGGNLGNCWSDWATNPGHPLNYNVPGTATAVDHVPNENCGQECCVGVRGNVNMAGIVDLADLSALVIYLTGGDYNIWCYWESDLTKNNFIDLVDLSSLVNYLTGGGYVLQNCF